MFTANFDGDTMNYIPIIKRKIYRPYTKKTMHKLAQQIFNNKSMRAKNRIRKLARLCAVVTIR
jgi:hypothetical protein